MITGCITDSTKTAQVRDVDVEEKVCHVQDRSLWDAVLEASLKS